MSEIKGRPNEPYYRREFKQEVFVYEETSNLGANLAESSYFNTQYNYFIFALVALLFLGSLCLLSLDLLFVRRRRSDDEEPAANRRRNYVPTSNPPRSLTPPPRHGLTPPPPRVFVNDANADNMPDCRLTGRRHNNTLASPERHQI